MKIEITKDHKGLKKGQLLELDGMICKVLISQKLAKPYKKTTKAKK